MRDGARCAVVDFDAVRGMFVQPHRTPWDGEEGRAQLLLGAEQVCRLAAGFVEAGWEVIVLDVVVPETARVYREHLARWKPAIVQLLPKWGELKRRFDERGPVLTAEELRRVYASQQEFAGYDARIDNTTLSPEQVAEQLASRRIASCPRLLKRRRARAGSSPSRPISSRLVASTVFSWV